MNGLFLFGLVFLAVVMVVVAIAVVADARRLRRSEAEPLEPGVVGEPGRPLGAAPGGSDASSTEVSAPPRAPHEYFKVMRPETGAEMKMRLYSLDEYEGGTRRRPRRPREALRRRPQSLPAGRRRVVRLPA